MMLMQELLAQRIAAIGKGRLADEERERERNSTPPGWLGRKLSFFQRRWTRYASPRNPLDAMRPLPSVNPYTPPPSSPPEPQPKRI